MIKKLNNCEDQDLLSRLVKCKADKNGFIRMHDPDARKENTT